jgi:hypothetical protein
LQCWGSKKLSSVQYSAGKSVAMVVGCGIDIPSSLSLVSSSSCKHWK